MRKTKLKKINGVMESLPDRFADTILHYVSYLSFASMGTTEAYPDEIRAMQQFNKNPKTLKWDQVRHLL